MTTLLAALALLVGACGGETAGRSAASSTAAVPASPTAPPPRATATPAPLPLGRVGGAESLACPQGSPAISRCTRVSVACPGIPDTSARLRLSGTTGAASRGTVLLTTGDTGTFFYRELSRFPQSRFSNAPPPNAAPGAEKVVGELIDALVVADGFLAVELAWDGQGLWDEPGGPRTMSCRFATVARWVYDNLHAGGARTLFAAQGTSGGASMIAFALAHYGLDEVLDLANLCGGPPLCPRCDSPAELAERLLNGNPRLNYPGTAVRFFIGEDDPFSAAFDGMNAYFNAITSAKSKQVIAPVANHHVEGSQAGKEALLGAIREAAAALR